MTKKNSVIVLINYFVGYLVIYPQLLGFLIISLYKYIGYDSSIPAQFIFYIVFLLGTCFLCKPLLIELVDGLKNNFLKILKIVGKNLVLGYGINIVINLVLFLLTSQTTSINQGNIETEFMSNPLLIVFIAVIFAPLVEEFVFRGIIYRFVQERKGFFWGALVSAAMFGGMHVIFSLFSLNFIDLLFVLPYFAQGFLIALSYYKSNSFAGAWLYHVINNLIAVGALLLLG